MKVRFYGYGILILGLTGLLASCKKPTSSPSKAWVVSTLAGSGDADFADGTGTAAKFDYPTGVAVDSNGIVYVAGPGNDRIRKITINSSGVGVVTTLAGSGRDFVDNTGDKAKFREPKGVAVDSNGIVYVADTWNHRIRKITAAGAVTTLAGSSLGFADGTGTAAKFNRPNGVAVASDGTVYVADAANNRIRKMTINSSGVGEVTTLAGSAEGFADGTGTAAQFSSPIGVAVDSSGNVYVADFGNNRIRKITINSSGVGVVSTLAGSGTAGFADGTGTAAQFNEPYGVAVDSDGNVYVADAANHRIRKMTINSSGVGEVTTLAGSAEGFAEGTAAQFSSPSGVAVDSNGTVYVADSGNNRIRKMEYRLP